MYSGLSSPRRAPCVWSPPGGVAIQGLATVTADNGILQAAYTFTPEQDVALNSLHVGAEFSVEALAGWQLDSG